MSGDKKNEHPGEITLGVDKRGIFIKAAGHVRAADCFSLREEAFSLLEESDGPRGVFIDLSECRYMDSTFIGLLIAMDSRLKKTGGRLSIHMPSPECLECLTRLGLERILHIDGAGVENPPEYRPLSDHGKPGEDFILSAHEALIEKSEEAKRKFGLLKEMLEKKLRREK
jgi:anti-anti-sigma factor